MSYRNPTCTQCKKKSSLVSGKTIYPHRPDLHHLPFYLCESCNAYVGCHPGTKLALGTPASKDTRAARSRAHSAFDPLWRNKLYFKSRTRAYNWLAQELKIKASQCHIGLFDISTCNRVVALCKELMLKL